MAEAFEVLWTQASFRDLDEILDFVAERDGIDRALVIYEHLRERIASLKTYPRRCRHVPELKAIGLSEYRELIAPPYRIFFRLVNCQATLLGVLDGRRDLEAILVQRALES